MATKLYRVRSTKSDGTGIVWIAQRNDPPVPYGDAIKGLNAHWTASERQRHSVDELFTNEEAKQWLEYLERHYGDLDSEIVEVALPLAPDAEALSYAPPAREYDGKRKDRDIHSPILRSTATRFSTLDIASVDIELLPDDTQLRGAFALIPPQPVSQGERGLRASGRGKA